MIAIGIVHWARGDEIRKLSSPTSLALDHLEAIGVHDLDAHGGIAARHGPGILDCPRIRALAAGGLVGIIPLLVARLAARNARTLVLLALRLAALGG